MASQRVNNFYGSWTLDTRLWAQKRQTNECEVRFAVRMVLWLGGLIGAFHIGPFSPTTLNDLPPLQGPSISQCRFLLPLFGRSVGNSWVTAPELKYLETFNDRGATETDLGLPAIVGGRTSKLRSLSLAFMRAKFCGLGIPSPAFDVGTKLSVQDLVFSCFSFLQKLPFARTRPNLPLLRAPTIRYSGRKALPSSRSDRAR